MNKNKNNPDTEHVLQLAAKFEPKSVRVMSEEEYEREFDTKFPVPVPTPKPARPKIVDLLRGISVKNRLTVQPRTVG